MAIPVVRGVIDRRILVNYRADPQMVAPLLPAPFRPRLVHGASLVGLCLIRLKHVRVSFWPGWAGINSENAAHRVAVEWDGDDGEPRQGVYVFRRDTSSRLNALAGGRLFPGRHHLARFTVLESADSFRVELRSADRITEAAVQAHRTQHLPDSSIFGSIEDASQFFEAGSIGYSPTPRPSRFQGLQLCCHRWRIAPLEVEAVRSSVFDDPAAFPPGSIALDCALLMEGIEHEWHTLPDLQVACPGVDARLSGFRRGR